MLNNGNKTNCEFTSDIVAYIYDEISASERAKFETHLAGCHECTNEFAGISNARLSLFEWRSNDFADLPTPQIVIPYKAKSSTNEEVSAGLFAGVRGWLSFANFPVAVAAVLLLCLGLGFLMLNYVGRGDDQIASNSGMPKIEPTDKPVIKPTVEPKKPETTVITETPNVQTSREVRPVKAAENRKPKTNNEIAVRNQANRNLNAKVPEAPTLSENYEESDDASLRLSDLFSEVDG
ncbi:MAG: anti-sigma factor family protein [Pyrinomonadaceae bacterium]